jgi:hypothetical protein
MFKVPKTKRDKPAIKTTPKRVILSHSLVI